VFFSYLMCSSSLSQILFLFWFWRKREEEEDALMGVTKVLQVLEKLEEEESLTWFCLAWTNHGRVHVICWLEISRRGGAGSTAVGGDAVKPHAFLRPSPARSTNSRGWAHPKPLHGRGLHAAPPCSADGARHGGSDPGWPRRETSSLIAARILPAPPRIRVVWCYILSPRTSVRDGTVTR
jgi:hypothetical protein